MYFELTREGADSKEGNRFSQCKIGSVRASCEDVQKWTLGRITNPPGW